MRHLYSLLWYLLTPLLLLRLVWRSRGESAYRQRIAERFGVFRAPRDDRRQSLWVHAVSVGELAAARLLIEQLLSEYPGCRLVVTTTTPTGSAQVRSMFGERVFHVYCPWDMPGSVRRFLARTHPALLVLMETELWPNLVHYARASDCRVLLANGRMSAKSARGYARVAPLTGPMLREMDGILCRSDSDSERFLSLGASPGKVKVSGNLKWEAHLAEPERAWGEHWHRQWGTSVQPVLLAASTHLGEEEQVLAAFRRIREQVPACRLVLAPRHPTRAGQVAELSRAAGYQTKYFSADESSVNEVLVVDTVGDLAALCGVATVVFIGGSLVPHGGHNPVEAILWGVPVLAGPHMYNFPDMVDALETAGALRRVTGAAQLAEKTMELISDDAQVQEMAREGQGVVQANRGALAATLRAVAGQLS